MKIVKKLSPIMESISNVGKDKKKMLDEDFDVNHPIGVLPHADAVATEQHIADRAAGLERRANPDKDPLVKELIDETASAKSRTLHYDVVDRKGLAKILTEAKKNRQKFKVGKSDKLGYRYFVDILPIYGSKGALEVDDDVTEVDGEEAGESLSESLTLNEDIEKDLRDYIKWCKDNGKEAKDGKSLDAYFAMKDKNTKKLDEAKYKTPMPETEDYVNSMYKAYKALKDRKTGYAAVYGYRKGKQFVPFFALKDSQDELNKVIDALKSREKGQTDVVVYTLFKNNLDDVEDTLREKGLLKESFEDIYDDMEPENDISDDELEIIYQVTLVNYPDIEEVEEFDSEKEAIDYAKENQVDYDEVIVEKITTNYVDIEDRDVIYEDGKTMDHYEDLDEDLQLYASSLKDFKPAKEAEELWNEIIEKGKLDDLEYELENVFKADDDKNASIDIEGLNDLLVNHPDFIRTLVGLDDAPLEDKDYDDKFDEEPVDNDDLILDDEDEEPVDVDTPIDDADEEEPIDYKKDKLDSEEDDDIEPLTDQELANEESDEYPEAPKYVDEEPKEEKKPSKWIKREDKEEDKVEEALDNDKEAKIKRINALRAKLKEGCGCDHPCDKEPELKLDDEDSDLDECNQPIKECDDLKECDASKDDELTENIANAFIKSRVDEAKKDINDDQKKYDTLVKKTLPLLESDEEVVDISDDEINEMVGAPTEADVKKEEPIKESDDKKPLEEACEKKEEIKEEVKPAEEVKKVEDKPAETKPVEECKEKVEEGCKDAKAK